jgi:outer membrane protein OmpA-like peptidoglycan-associated protein
MKLFFTAVTISVTVFCCTVAAQQTKNGQLYFNLSMSDYNVAKSVKDSSLGKTLSQKEWLQPAGKSLGAGIGYWKTLTRHIDFSATFNGTFANLPKGFIKNDSVGQACFATQLDALLHLKMLKNNSPVNPFLTAGAGAGYFYKKACFYAPAGVGIQFDFSEGSSLVLQTQWRLKMGGGLMSDYVMYSLGFIQKAHKEKEQKQPKENVTVTLPVKTIYADSDGDGVPDDKDNCPYAKGNINGCPDSDGDGITDKEDKCPLTAGSKSNNGCPLYETVKAEPPAPDSTTFIVYFEPGKAILRSDAYNTLSSIVALLKSNRQLQVAFKGHTDNVGNEKANYKLSLDRASVCAAYAESFLIDKKRIAVEAFGKQQPVADLTDPLLQWKNRRVEVIVHKAKGQVAAK